jgi:hypothetical protein
MYSFVNAGNVNNAGNASNANNVKHDLNFGNGVVVSYEGNASDMRVQVNFGREGLKWLAMEFAKLTPI